MSAGEYEYRSYSFSHQHEPIVASKSSKLPNFIKRPCSQRLACHWRLRLVLLVQVDGTSCIQYGLETWNTPEVRMFLPSYPFTIVDRIFACRRSILAQKASHRTSFVANDSGFALAQSQEMTMNAKPRALVAIKNHNQNSSSRRAYIHIVMFQEHESHLCPRRVLDQGSSYSRVHRFLSPCRCPDLRNPQLNDLLFKPGNAFITDNGRSLGGRRVDPVEKELEHITQAYISERRAFSSSTLDYTIPHEPQVVTTT